MTKKNEVIEVKPQEDMIIRDDIISKDSLDAFVKEYKQLSDNYVRLVCEAADTPMFVTKIFKGQPVKDEKTGKNQLTLSRLAKDVRKIMNRIIHSMVAPPPEREAFQEAKRQGMYLNYTISDSR